MIDERPTSLKASFCVEIEWIVPFVGCWPGERWNVKRPSYGLEGLEMNSREAQYAMKTTENMKRARKSVEEQMGRG